MLANVPVLTLTSLAFLKGAFSQRTTMDVYPDDPSLIEGLEGEILGTGDLGTTFVVSGRTSGIPITGTIVKGATYLSEFAAASTLGAEFEVNRVCGFDSDNVGACTAVVKGEGGGFTFTTTESGSVTITFAPIPIELSASSAAPGTLIVALVAIAPILGFLVVLL